MMQQSIFVPVTAMMLLTCLVWIYMYIRRISYLNRHGIDAQELVAPENLVKLIPETINRSANNLKNLFEMPVLFYVLCIMLFITGNVNAFYLYTAWIFVALRAVHSAIHCTVNRVMLRFVAYFFSSIALGVMIFRFAFIDLKIFS